MRAVYVIRDNASGACKVGVASNVANRLKGLQVGHASRLTLSGCWYFEDAAAVEAEAHRLLADAQSSGEWFLVSPADAAFAVGRAAQTVGQATITPPQEADTAVSPLHRWRKDRALSAEQLAAQLGVHQSVISRIERGLRRPKDDLEVAIIKLTGLTRDDLAAPRLAQSKAESEAA